MHLSTPHIGIMVIPGGHKVDDYLTVTSRSRAVLNSIVYLEGDLVSGSLKLWEQPPGLTSSASLFYIVMVFVHYK